MTVLINCVIILYFAGGLGAINFTSSHQGVDDPCSHLTQNDTCIDDLLPGTYYLADYIK